MQETQQRIHLERFDPDNGLETASADLAEPELYRLIEHLPERRFTFREGRWHRPMEPICAA